MPIPKPRDNETQKEFISRCMGDDAMNEEYPEKDQRAAICYQTWRNRNKAADEVERKAISLSLKAEKEGAFVARIATLNVVDLDGDITMPGAFPLDKVVLVSAYQHGSWQGALPVGKATIKEQSDNIIAEGEFNLQTTSGREHYEAIKFTGGLQEWSYGFKPIEWEMGEQDGKEVRFLKKVNPFEISPVIKGAGVGTMTLAIKSEGSSYIDQAEAVLAAISDLVARTKLLADLRRKEGRMMSEANISRMKKLMENMRGMADDIGHMLDSMEPVDKALKLFAEFTAIQYQMLEAR